MDDIKNEPTEVKFNAGLDTLKYISEIQREMQKFAVEGHISGKAGFYQHALIRDLQQIWLASLVLIKDDEFFNYLDKRIESIQPQTTKRYNKFRPFDDDFQTEPLYSLEIDKEIWACVKELRRHLQKTGIFMPSKRETMF